MHPRRVLILLLLTATTAGLAIYSKFRSRLQAPSSPGGIAEGAEPPFPATLEGLLRLVERKRQLAFKRPPVLRGIAAWDLHRRRQEAVELRWPKVLADQRVRAFVALGYRWDPPYPLAAALTGLTEDQAGGYFDAEANILYHDESADLLGRADLRDRWLAEVARILLRQNFPAAAPDPLPDESDDSWLARAALIDGDVRQTVAKCIVAEIASGGRQNAGPTTHPQVPFYAAPLFFRERFLFPATVGLAYVEALQSRLSPAGFNEVYSAPPTSTAEIFLLSRGDGAAGWPAGKIDFKMAPVAGRSPFFTNTAGEFGIFLLMKSQLRQEQAIAAAGGWRGDRYAVYPGEPGRGDDVVWRSAWASPDEAREFAAALAAQVINRHGMEDQPSFHLPGGEAVIDHPERSLRIRIRMESPQVTAILAGSAESAAGLEKVFVK